MNFEEQNKDSVTPSDIPNSSPASVADSRIGLFFEQLYTVNSLHLVSSILQIMLGLSVVLVSILDLMRPLWVSSLMCMLGSVTVMVGSYFLYSVVMRKAGRQQLLIDAMRRIMNAYN